MNKPKAQPSASSPSNRPPRPEPAPEAERRRGATQLLILATGGVVGSAALLLASLPTR